MKISRGFLFAMLGVVLFTYYLQTLRPHPFDWDTSFCITSTDPFGTAIFDSVMRETLPQGMSYTDDLEYYLKNKLCHRGDIDEALFIIGDHFGIGLEEDSLLAEYMSRGGKVLIAATNCRPTYEVNEDYKLLFPSVAFSHIAYTTSYSYASTATREFLSEADFYAPLTLLADSLHPKQELEIVENFVQASFFVSKLDYYTPLGEIEFKSLDLIEISIDEGRRNTGYDMRRTSIIYAQRGKGLLVYSSLPLYLTNYGMLSPDGRAYIERVFDLLKDRHVVRYLDWKQDGKDVFIQQEEGMFSYFLQRPALSLGLRLLIIGCLLALFVNARRRVRAIDVTPKQPNVTLHFLRQVSLLYRPTSDYQPLLRRRFQTFAELVRRRVGTDVAAFSQEGRQEAARALAFHTGEKFEDLLQLLRDVQGEVSVESPLSAKDYKALVDRMNYLIDKL